MNKEIEKEEQVTKVSFVDKNRNKIDTEITITYRNGYKEFTMCNNGCQHDFVPGNEPQQRLFDLWNKYHLNGSNTGTPKQDAAIKKWLADGKQYDYTKACNYLKSLNADGTEMSAIKKAHIEENVAIEIFQLQKYESWIKDFKIHIKDFYDRTTWFCFSLKNWRGEEPIIKDFDDPMNTVGRIWPGDNVYAVKTFEKKVLNKAEKAMSEVQKRIDDLEMQSLFVDRNPETGEPFKYGHAHYHLPLPEDIDEQIEEIVQEIQEAEEERRGEPLDSLSDTDLITLIEEKTSFEGRDARLAAAFVRMFDLTENDFDDIEIDGNRCKVQGTDYLAGNEEEMNEEFIEEVKNSAWAFNASFLASQTDIPSEAFEAMQDKCEGSNDAILRIIEKTCGIEEFADAAKTADGRSHFLNRYDGTEDKAEIDGEEFFAYRTY